MKEEILKHFTNQTIIKKLEASTLLNQGVKEFPWVILVSDIKAKNILDLTWEGRDNFWKDINKVAEAMKRVYNPDQINIAMLGNITPQLHCHVIARFKGDAAWPNATFSLKTTDMSTQEVSKMNQELIKYL